MILVNIGIGLLIALGVGKVFTKFKMPAILGWLVTGMVIGPYGFKIINNDILTNANYQTIISVLECVVGIMIGSELILKNLRKSGKNILITTLFQSLGTFVVVSVCFGIVFYFMNIPLMLAFIFGAIALATAPAPALSIIKEFNTKGPVTDTLIPMAALDDVVGMVVFFTVISVVGATDASYSLMTTLFLMIVVPVSIGVLTGLIVGKIMNLTKTKHSLTLELLGGIALVSFLGMYLNQNILAQPMINFMILGMSFAAGFVNVLNETQLENVMSIAKPLISFAIVLVILNLGAPLNYHLILGAGVLSFVYIASRMVGKYYGAQIGASLCGMEKTVRKYLGLTLLPHSGVSLVFTGIAVNVLMPIDSSLALIVQGTIASAAIINEVIAVIVSKKAFEWAGEISTKVE